MFWELSGNSVFMAVLLKRAFPKSALAVRLSTAPGERLGGAVESVVWAFWGSGSVFGALNLARFRSVVGTILNL